MAPWDGEASGANRAAGSVFRLNFVLDPYWSLAEKVLVQVNRRQFVLEAVDADKLNFGAGSNFVSEKSVFARLIV